MPSIQDRQWHCLVQQRKLEQHLFCMTLSMKGLYIWSVMTSSTVARRPLLIHLNSLSCVPAWHEIKPKWRPRPRCLLASPFYKDRPQNLKLPARISCGVLSSEAQLRSSAIHNIHRCTWQFERDNLIGRDFGSQSQRLRSLH